MFRHAVFLIGTPPTSHPGFIPGEIPPGPPLHALIDSTWSMGLTLIHDYFNVSVRLKAKLMKGTSQRRAGRTRQSLPLDESLQVLWGLPGPKRRRKEI